MTYDQKIIKEFNFKFSFNGYWRTGETKEVEQFILQALSGQKQVIAEQIKKEKISLPASVYAVPGGRVRETFNTAYNEAIDKALEILEKM